MKLAKHALFLLGLVGILGVVMPLAELRKGPVGVTLTARELSFGLEKTHGILDKKLPAFAEKHLPGVIRDTRDDVRLVAGYLKWAVLVYTPAVLLSLIGLAALSRKRLGRGLAGASVLVGVIALGAWIGLHYAIDYALVEAEIKGASIELTSGAHMLLLTAAAGIGIGIAALVRPEQGPDPIPRTPAA